jgi:hypothetical protein
MPLVKVRARTTASLDPGDQLCVEALLEEDARWISVLATGGIWHVRSRPISALR